MKLVFDMNLTPNWVKWLSDRGFEAVHWDSIGDREARDEEIMTWAASESRVVVTNDLDFGQILALTHATGPSVVLIRGPKVLPSQVGDVVVGVLTTYTQELEQGALIVIDEVRQRVRLLPL